MIRQRLYSLGEGDHYQEGLQPNTLGQEGHIPPTHHLREDDIPKERALQLMLQIRTPALSILFHALKITAGRQKDLDDCAILLPKTTIRTREQAQQVLDRHILPDGQQKNAESIEEAAVSVAVEHYRDRTYREALRNTLGTIQTAADEFTQKADYLAALSIYEVLVTEAIKHYFAIEIGYLLFTPILAHCIDGLDSCVAEAGENQEMRLRAFKGLFAIYRFSAGSILDLGEDIPDLLVGNSTREERQILAGWVRDELARLASNVGSANKEYHHYQLLLRRLEQEDLAV